MSQEKVDRYKYEKANRKKIMRKQRTLNALRTTVVTVVCLAVLGWIGYSLYDTYSENAERPVASVNYDSVNDYVQGLSQ